jgi:hypothetical protein
MAVGRLTFEKTPDDSVLLSKDAFLALAAEAGAYYDFWQAANALARGVDARQAGQPVSAEYMQWATDTYTTARDACRRLDEYPLTLVQKEKE